MSYYSGVYSIFHRFIKDYVDSLQPDKTNRYVYCYNNPINLIDPLGLAPEEDEAKIAKVDAKQEQEGQKEEETAQPPSGTEQEGQNARDVKQVNGVVPQETDHLAVEISEAPTPEPAPAPSPKPSAAPTPPPKQEGLKVIGDPAYQKQVNHDLKTIESKPHGSALVTSVRNSGQQNVIEPVPKSGPHSSPGNKAVPQDTSKAQAGIPTGATVYYDPNRWKGGRDATGSSNRPPFVGLGHELGHARMMNIGKQSFNDKPRISGTTPLQERESVQFENWIRQEHGLPPRPSYY